MNVFSYTFFKLLIISYPHLKVDFFKHPNLPYWVIQRKSTMTKFPSPTLFNITILQLILFTTSFIQAHFDNTRDNSAEGQFYQIYKDVKPANTTFHLETIRQVPLSTYKLSYERSSKANRIRVGVIGPELAALIPDAVDILPKRILPPLEKGGNSLTLTNIPIVNDQTLFFYGIGAVKELDKIISGLESQLDIQVQTFLSLQEEVTRVERMFEETSDGGSQLRMRELAAKAKLSKASLDLELERRISEEEYINLLQQTEMEQVQRSESITKNRLDQENKASKLRYDQNAKQKLEASRLIEAARSLSAEAISKIEHQRTLENQRAAQKIKEETEKVY